MIILDTNVISELMNPRCDAALQKWIDSIDPSDIRSTAITSYEIAFGIMRLPDGKRKDALLRSWQIVADQYLRGRVLPLDQSAALTAGEARKMALSVGNNCDICDVLIAGIAAHHNARVATRNVRHFDGLPIDLIDPWSATV